MGAMGNSILRWVSVRFSLGRLEFPFGLRFGTDFPFDLVLLELPFEIWS